MEKDQAQLVADLERFVGAPTVSGWLQHMAGVNDDSDWDRLRRTREELRWWHEADDGHVKLFQQYESLLISFCRQWEDVVGTCFEKIHDCISRVREGSEVLEPPLPFDGSGPYGVRMQRLARRAMTASKRVGRYPKRHKDLEAADRQTDRIPRIHQETNWVMRSYREKCPPESLERQADHWGAQLLRLKLEHALGTLPKEQRMVVHMRWSTFAESGQFLASKVIAKVLQKTINGVDLLYSRAVKELKGIGIDLDGAERATKA